MSDNRLIRMARLDDAVAIQQVHQSSILGIDRSFYSDDELASWATGLTPDYYVRCIVDDGETFLVSEDAAGNVVGWAAYKGDELTGLYVRPQVAGQGLGRALLSEAEGRMRAAGTTIASIKASLSGRGFYAAHGYSEAGRHGSTTRGGVVIEIVDMTKPLRPHAEERG